MGSSRSAERIRADQRASFEKAIRAGEQLLIDTLVLIAYLETSDSTYAVAGVLIDEFVRTGRNAAVVSAVSVTQLLVKPLRTSPVAAAHCAAFLNSTANLSIISVDVQVASEAARLRATHSFETPDALIIATGVVSGVSRLITNDGEWKKKLMPMTAHAEVTELAPYI